jgi:nucleotidyltransferase/DNA polymerase involved in DNA repair
MEELESVPGVGPATARKLSKAGYRDIASLASAKPSEVAEKTGLRPAVAKKIVQAAKKTKPPVRVPERRESLIASFLSRIAGKESTLSIDLTNVGFEVGEQKISATGNIKIVVKTLE